jgi:hypothetical protein
MEQPNTLPVASLRLQRGAEHLYACGPRAIAEMLSELGEAKGVTPEILTLLDAWRGISPAAFRAVLDTCCGGRDFPPSVSVVQP